MGHNTHTLRAFLAMILIGLGTMFMTTLFTLFLLKFLWDSTVPTIFPGFVHQGLIADSVSYWTAAKLSILFAIVGGRFISVRSCQNLRG